ncbi:hypothetical protein ABZ921_19390 [Streptomyces atriruber]|uniref:Siphovirus-type tail component C-terminal domain-containing protein n=1 Tax=Streptomyces atriruber TaxID=545121 RepID=A0ABV3BP71_9ACTN
MAAGDLVTLPGHVEYGGLLLGPFTPYGWKSVTGWEDSPGTDSGTVNRAAAHGAYPGRLLAQPRTITLDGVVIRSEPLQMSTMVRRLSSATALRDDEVPLVIRLDDSPPLLCFARCIRRAIPVAAGGYAVGVVQGAALQFEASDPRRYELVEQQAETRLPMAEPGLDWHLDPGPESLNYPLDFGEPGSTGTVTATNDGDAAAHPLVRFRGPVALPSITNITTGAVLEYDITLAADDELLVDTDNGTVTLNRTASRLYTATARSVPENTFTLPPSSASLTFRAAPGSNDPRAACSLRWRSAYW